MYDPNRVNLTDEEHALAKELNEMFEALVLGEGDKLKETTDAVLEAFKTVPAAANKRALLFKVLLANVSDEAQERLFAPVA